MYINQLYSQLEGFGVYRILPKVGGEYDPQLHEAFDAVEGGESNTIQAVKMPGFKLHDRVLQPAKVVIFK